MSAPAQARCCPATFGPGCLGFRCQECGRATGTYELTDIADEIASLNASLRALREARRAAVLDLAGRGASERVIGKAAGLSGVRVHQILAASRKNADGGP